MKIPVMTFLIVALFAAGVHGIGDDDPSVSFQEARERGRAKSRFLVEQENSSPATTIEPTADVVAYDASVKSILQRNCLACHGPEYSEGRLRVDQLDPDLLNGDDLSQWRSIYNVLSNGEMPPEGESDEELKDVDRGTVVEWLSAELKKASVVRRSQQSHTSFRRLTKYEYNYALQDLLGLPFLPADRLPPETASEDGFKNSSELLQMSPSQFDVYREIGLQALQRAIVTGERPTPVTYIVSMQEAMASVVAGDQANVFSPANENYDKERRRQHLWNRETEQGVHFTGGSWKPSSESDGGSRSDDASIVLAVPRSNEFKMNLDRFLPDEGIMRVRVRVGRSTMNPGEYASLRLYFSAHTSNNANFKDVISKQDLPVTASADHPEFIDFHISLADIQRNPFRKLQTTFPRRDEFLHIRNIANSNGREDPFQLLIDSIEITAPYYDEWPPRTHTAIFFESQHQGNEDEYGREVLKRFLRRIWRRSASSREVDQFMALFNAYRPEFDSFEEAMVEVLATALATPEFLYVVQRREAVPKESPNTVSDSELASRLALFLWCSIPDERLLQLAEQGKLRDSATLALEVNRMLADPRAGRFSKHFVVQWLGLDGLNSVVHVTDEDLKTSMGREPVAFFEEVLQHNRSIMDFIHSDYVMVNERLANHFRIPEVRGPHFQKVSIEPRMNRGGLLTGAAVLSMNSDGKDSHPLKRGVWMLERILHDPPPPPPPNVPEVDLTDPEILKMTLKERIADHRNKAACRSCHSRIDPWGIAFENYDALGVYRTRIGNEPVDASAELFGSRELAGMDGLKRYLLAERQDQFALAMVHKMTAYALGRPMTFGDHAELEDLTARFRERGDGLHDLVQLIVNSKLFHAKQID